MGWLFGLVLVQVLIAGVVVIVLMKALNKELIEAALEKFSVLQAVQGTSQINIRCASSLDEGMKSRFEALRCRRFADVQLNFEEDSALKGGVVITAGQEVFDFSVANRLQQFWS